ncbi:MAG: DUF2934 domain-containing protein [Rhodocyclales bacterium]|nr:DUF2934 domain-containing protein [Rhodocyclales bacterium]
MTEAKKTAKTPAGKRTATPAKSSVKVSATTKKPAVKAVKPKAEAPAKPARSRAKKPTIAHEQRRNYIEVAAYYIAARRDFAPGDPLQDWIAAEAEIDRLLAEGRLGA